MALETSNRILNVHSLASCSTVASFQWYKTAPLSVIVKDSWASLKALSVDIMLLSYSSEGDSDDVLPYTVPHSKQCKTLAKANDPETQCQCVVLSQGHPERDVFHSHRNRLWINLRKALTCCSLPLDWGERTLAWRILLLVGEHTTFSFISSRCVNNMFTTTCWQTDVVRWKYCVCSLIFMC